MGRSVCVLVACCACNAAWGIEPTELVNENPRTLVFDNSASRADLVDIPVLVILDPQRIDYTQVSAPATELRFHVPGAAEDLPFEIEEWDPAGRSYVWVLVPHITAGSTTETIEMFFGQDAGGVAQPSLVWAGYDLVLHGKQGAFTSPTPSGYVGIPTAITNAPGKIGSAIQFVDDGNEHTIELPAALLDGWPKFTLEMWLYLDYESSYGYRSGSGLDLPEPAFVTKTQPTPSDGQPINGGRVYWPFIDFLFTAQLDTHYANGDDQYANTFVRLRRWSHLLMTFDGKTQWLYRDGDFSDVTALATTSTLVPGPGLLVLGGRSHPINGMLDEVRISRAYRDPDWVLAQYLAMSDRFITFPRPGEVL